MFGQNLGSEFDQELSSTPSYRKYFKNFFHILTMQKIKKLSKLRLQFTGETDYGSQQPLPKILFYPCNRNIRWIVK